MIDSGPGRSMGKTLAMLAVTLLVTACSGVESKPFKYTPGSEIPPGPGLLSGQEGEWSWGFGGKVPQDPGQDGEPEVPSKEFEPLPRQ